MKETFAVMIIVVSVAICMKFSDGNDTLIVKQPEDYTIGFHLFESINTVHSLRIENLTIENIENGSLCTSPFTRIVIENNEKFPNLSRRFFYNDCPTLKILNISGNREMWLESDSFDGLTNLEELGITNQTIVLITSDFFRNLRHLKVLRIRFCKVEAIERDAFDPLVNLKTLHLEGNNLGGIDGLLTKLDHLEEIIILEKIYHFPWAVLRHFHDLTILNVTTDVSDFRRGLISNTFPELESAKLEIDHKCDHFMVLVIMEGRITSPTFRHVKIQGHCITSSSHHQLPKGCYHLFIVLMLLNYVVPI